MVVICGGLLVLGVSVGDWKDLGACWGEDVLILCAGLGGCHVLVEVSVCVDACVGGGGGREGRGWWWETYSAPSSLLTDGQAEALLPPAALWERLETIIESTNEVSDSLHHI